MIASSSLNPHLKEGAAQLTPSDFFPWLGAEDEEIDEDDEIGLQEVSVNLHNIFKTKPGGGGA
jgi:hypothetical protein